MAPSDKISTVALTGATGFVGRNLTAALLAAGFHVKALTRRPQSVETAGDLVAKFRSNEDPPEDLPEGALKNADKIHACGTLEWIEGALDDIASLNHLCTGVETVIHLAGLTKALKRSDFFAVNAKGCRDLADAADNQKVKNFILVSSLAARAPELSHYGASKRAGELTLEFGHYQFKSCILRPPAIYGPAEQEFYKMVRAIRRKKTKSRPKQSRKHFLFPAMGGLKSRVSFIHIYDLCNALTLIANPLSFQSGLFEIDDLQKDGYSSKQVARALYGDKTARPLLIPLKFWAVAPLGIMSNIWAAVTKKPLMTSLSHLRYLTHSDWAVKEDQRLVLENWSPKFDLFSGLEQTINWTHHHNRSPAE